VLDICDFKAIGQKMPKGTGVDATINNGAVVASHKKRKWSVADNNSRSILKVLELGDARESKMSALKLRLEFRSNNDKIKARQKLYVIIFDKDALEQEDDVRVDDSGDESTTI
jgi:hypothetical protein